MRWLAALGLLVAQPLLVGCDDGPGTDPPTGDIEYYCAEWAAAWCPAYAECEPFEFPTAFRSLEECVEQSEADCLDPPAGRDRCLYAEPEETDACVAYIDGSVPDSCSDLFGRNADMAPCETICVD